MIPMMGWIATIVPARAGFTFYNGTAGNSQFNSAVQAASLAPEGPFVFTAANLVSSNHEYDDPTSHIDFFAFSNNSSSNPGQPVAFSINATRLVAASGTGSLKITLPSNVFALGMTLTTLSGTGIYCGGVGSTDPSCSNQIVVSGSNIFFGVIGTTPINTLWIGVQLGSAPTIVSFSADTGFVTPEPASMGLFGAGLLAMAVLRRRRRAAERSARY